MSKYTIQVDQFLLNNLQPAIDRLNLSLVSMEETGYNSKSINNTRRKLNKLMVTYDFLKEYAYGDEEIEIEPLRDIMKMSGAYALSTKSHNQIVQSTRNNLDINETGGCLDFIRIYINDEISTSSTLAPLSEYTTFKIYASESVESIEVEITVTGSSPVTYTGVNHVTIPDIQLDEIDGITLAITTVNLCGETTVTNIDYVIQDVACTAATYWIGGTTERFSIHESTPNESTDITIDPNSGTKLISVELDFDWIATSVDMEEFLFRESVTQTVTVAALDSHALLLIPITLEVTDINELVSGDPVDMEEDTHYASFPITSPTLKQFNCIYFRDLTSFTFTEERTFQFTINKI